MTNRTKLTIIILLILAVSTVSGATVLYYYLDTRNKFLLLIGYLCLIAAFVCSLVVILYILIKGGVKNAVLDFKIRRLIEQNLISIKAFYDTSDNGIYYLPQIKIDLRSCVIKIKIDDVKIRKQIESYEDTLSSALPGNYVVDNFYIDKYGKNFVIQFHDESTETQQTFKNLSDYLEEIDKNKKFEFEVDNRHKIDLLTFPHWLVSGSTGSGKSFLVQLLIIQFIRKGFEVSVYDVKKSYSAFEKYVEYSTDPEEILTKLESVAEEMNKRQIDLSDELRRNVRALAIDKGYKPKIIVIEEYIGLKTLLNKDQLKTFENLIKRIVVLARSVNIHLFIVAQSSSVDLIDASIKNNLNKIFLGHLASNIAVSTFGNGVEIPYFTEVCKGYGYIQLDRIEQVKVPNVVYSVDELKNIELI